jgi:hypothetical protein
MPNNFLSSFSNVITVLTRNNFTVPLSYYHVYAMHITNSFKLLLQVLVSRTIFELSTSKTQV